MSKKTKPGPSINPSAVEQAWIDERIAAQAARFAIGEVVQLTSGGRPMTVANRGCCGDIEVVWFADCGHLQNDSFDPAMLMAAQQEMPF